MGEGRYRALLCLVPIPVPAGRGGVRVEVIDPLDDRLDPQPLAEVLGDPAIEIVLHAARQDVALLRRVWHAPITNLFDTQVAEHLDRKSTRLNSSHMSISYAVFCLKKKKKLNF